MSNWIDFEKGRSFAALLCAVRRTLEGYISGGALSDKGRAYLEEFRKMLKRAVGNFNSDLSRSQLGLHIQPAHEHAWLAVEKATTLSDEDHGLLLWMAGQPGEKRTVATVLAKAQGRIAVLEALATADDRNREAAAAEALCSELLVLTEPRLQERALVS